MLHPVAVAQQRRQERRIVTALPVPGRFRQKRAVLKARPAAGKPPSQCGPFSTASFLRARGGAGRTLPWLSASRRKKATVIWRHSPAACCRASGLGKRQRVFRQNVMRHVPVLSARLAVLVNRARRMQDTAPAAVAAPQGGIARPEMTRTWRHIFTLKRGALS